MAKIFVSFRTGLVKNKAPIGPYYEGLFRSLVRNGNDVLYFNGSEFLKDSWNGSNTLKNNLDVEKIENKIKKFNPDLVITFNYTTYKNLHKIVDCPICIWDADLPYYFSDKDTIKDNLDRFYFLCFSEHNLSLSHELFGASKERIFHVPTATDFRAEKRDIKQNISFIGTNFKFSLTKDQLKEIITNPLKLENFNRIRAEFEENYDVRLEDVLAKYNIPPSCFADLTEADFRNCIRGKERAQILNEVVPLGLRLYGNIYTDWFDVSPYFLDLALCYDNGDVADLLSNQEIYNASRIGISISHPQSYKGFPFRVADIMATNACLVSDWKPDQYNMFGKYLKIPMYQTKYEAYTICKDLLNDEKKRQDIVLKSQQVIDEHFRFENQLKRLEGIFGLSLLDQKEKGRFEKMGLKDFSLKKRKSIKQILKDRAAKAIRSFFNLEVARK